MSLSYFYSDQLNSWYETKHDFVPFIWPIRKKFSFRKIWKKNSTKYVSSFRYLLWFIGVYISILVLKNGHQSIDSLSSIFANHWGNYKFARIAAKMIFFSIFWIDITYILFWPERSFKFSKLLQWAAIQFLLKIY